ncbi:vWA domain-containing protein [Limnoglobus roseus]|uniref:VWA domain-containing protein n=1 Tax=Limnoglobus roseus TaxID=2598579 RepID=A0A5C1ALZ7_9BACT|nr:vWA domain-containing protein [Limnoglobus roseus]QEL20241.1 VWA domain-containing protein [Limnoglobus roseus]
MPYSAEISRTNPACVLILIDQSKSMDEPFAGQPDKLKSEGVADAVNRLIQNMVLKCAKIDGVRDYFHVGLIGYGGELRAGLGGSLPDDVLVPISKLADKPLRVENRVRLVEDGEGGTIEQNVKFPVWYDPTARGRTLMNGAFEAAELVISSFILSYPESYPPMVLNITDGKPSDANPLPVANRLKKVGGSDGPVLVFNLLLSAEPKPPIYFIDDESLLLDTYSKLLFRMSSILPPKLVQAAKADGFPVNAGARGVVFNADLVAVVRFLDIGTRITTGLR